MTFHIKTEPLTAGGFAPYGDVLEAAGAADKLINQGKCGRFHDRAQLDFSDGAAGISIFQSETVTLPLKLELVERHPEGSQAFVPMSADPFLVVVAADADGIPVDLRAFVTTGGQAINYHRGTWHGVLTPLAGPGLFAVVDRIGAGANLQEHWLEQSCIIDAN
ncbi:ureidoglycolate lyase [Sulfitobacter sp. F26204]|uniref:ureidoglycolate lyase n=1 Tax=Sulfitobacter sp. F26204 TaxID=2996014 RepID=UPI00225E449E|nr:ureidoglycolate lyase [Sulfitobacter sp. F26204]MCX7560240.1 ureidoglycolate lyase [Sulfitobacter sp. F26204]